ncbi:hypothetical protein D9M68_954330 [compost metagenome]
MCLGDMRHQHTHGEQREGLETIQVGRQGPGAEASQASLLAARVVVVVDPALLLHGPGHRDFGQEDQQCTDEDAPERQAHSLFSLIGSNAGVWV